MFQVNHKTAIKVNGTDAQHKQTVSSTAAALDRPATANMLRITIEKASGATGSATPVARFYSHGTDPTDTNGIPLYDAESRSFMLTELVDLKFIRAQAFDVTFYCEWFRVN